MTINHSHFWRKFFRYLLVGLSCMVLLYFFQATPLPLFAQSTLQQVCPTDAPTGLNPHGVILNAGTRSVNLFWNAVPNNPTNQHYLTVRGPNRTLLEGVVTGTSRLVDGFTDGETYNWSVRAYNSACQNAPTVQATFTILPPGGVSPGTCPNANQCITCGFGEDQETICPTPQNNCQAICPGQTIGQLSCNINQQLLNPQGPAPYNYSFTGNGFSSFGDPITSYQWDLTNDNSFDAFGQSVQQGFFSSATVRLQVNDQRGRFGTCFTNVNPPTTQPGQCSQLPTQETQCFGQQLCSVNLTRDANCNIISRSQPFNCFNSAQCGFSQPGQCTPSTFTETQCVGIQLCTVNVTNNANNICGNVVRSQPFNCFNSAQCGFSQQPTQPTIPTIPTTFPFTGGGINQFNNQQQEVNNTSTSSSSSSSSSTGGSSSAVAGGGAGGGGGGAGSSTVTID